MIPLTTAGWTMIFIAALLAAVSAYIWLLIYRRITVQKPSLPRHLAITYSLLAIALFTHMLEEMVIGPLWLESVALIAIVAAGMSWLDATFNIAEGEV